MLPASPAASSTLPERPPNDAFTDATTVASIPYADTVDTTLATTGPEDQGAETNCFGYAIFNTVWYRFTPSTDATLAADGIGSDFRASSVVFEEADPGELSIVACDASGLVSLDASAGTTYYILVGQAEPLSPLLGDTLLNFHLGEAGSLAGRVVDDGSEPVHDCRVFAWEIGRDLNRSALTNSQGEYQIEGLAAGEYKVEFCFHEWYDDKPDFESADPVTVGRQETSGVNAIIDLPPRPSVFTDLAVTELSMRDVPLETDYGTAPAGWVREIEVAVENAGPADSAADLGVWVCGKSERRCDVVGAASYTLAVGADERSMFRWNTLGILGDVTIFADVCPRFPSGDTDKENNTRSLELSILVSGLSFGANRPNWAAFGGPDPYNTCGSGRHDTR
jgi:hypothetical protein